MDSSAAEVTELMDRLGRGSREAAGQLVALFYPELRRMARAHMRGERRRHTWQPTVLVNQLYLELVKVKAFGQAGRSAEEQRRAFFGLAAHLMKRLLIHYSRPLARKVEMTDLADSIEIEGPAADDLATVEDLLERLEQVDPQFRAVAEMKVLEGMSMEEIAAELDIPLRTAYRRWTFVRTWLAGHLSPHEAAQAVDKA